MGWDRVLSIDFFRLSPQCGGSAGAVISLTLQWTKYGTRTIGLSRKCKLDGRKVRLRKRFSERNVAVHNNLIHVIIPCNRR